MGQGSVSFHRLTSPTAVRLAIGECQAMGREAFADFYGFGEATKYPLIYDGAEYDSKAIAAVAYRYQHPDLEAPTAQNSSGGRNSGQAGWALVRLGFEVKGIPPRTAGWSLHEVETTVDAYFKVKEGVDRGEPIHIQGTCTGLAAELEGRNGGAVRLKFDNISAYLNELGRTYLAGTSVSMDRGQKLLKWVIDDRFQFGLALADAPKAVVVGPPKKPRPPKSTDGTGKQIDWAARDERNRILGQLGEGMVVAYENAELAKRGSERKALWVSKDEGDGVGYDVRSWDENDEELKIEVKTTMQGISTPFFMSAAEKERAAGFGAAYRIYRLFQEGGAWRMYMLSGDPDKLCSFEPTAYRVIPGQKVKAVALA